MPEFTTKSVTMPEQKEAVIKELKSQYVYEVVIIVRQDIPSHDVQNVINKFVKSIPGLDDKIIRTEYWGLRHLSYLVKKNKRGHYIMLVVKGDSPLIMELRRKMKIDENIIKYNILRNNYLPKGHSVMMSTSASSSSDNI